MVINVQRAALVNLGERGVTVCTVREVLDFPQSISGWWFGTWILRFSIYWECHHPNWRTHIFQRGGYTTNQIYVLQGREETKGSSVSSFDTWFFWSDSEELFATWTKKSRIPNCIYTVCRQHVFPCSLLFHAKGCYNKHRGYMSTDAPPSRFQARSFPILSSMFHLLSPVFRWCWIFNLLVVPCLFRQFFPFIHTRTRSVAAFSRLSTYDQAKTSILEHSGLRDGRALATWRVRGKNHSWGPWFPQLKLQSYTRNVWVTVGHCHLLQVHSEDFFFELVFVCFCCGVCLRWR